MVCFLVCRVLPTQLTTVFSSRLAVSWKRLALTIVNPIVIIEHPFVSHTLPGWVSATLDLIVWEGGVTVSRFKFYSLLQHTSQLNQVDRDIKASPPGCDDATLADN